MTGVTNVWSSNATKSKDRNTIAKDDQPLKGKAWRVKIERENSPLVESYEELGEKLKKVGLNVSADSKSTSSPSSSSPSKPSRFSSSSTIPSIPTLDRTATRSDSKPIQPFETSSRPSSPRPTLRPLQVSGASNSTPQSISRSPSTTKPASPLKTSSFAHLATSSSTSLTLLPSTKSLSSDTTHSIVEEDQETCPKCSLPLGYGQFVELSSGAIIHFDCFLCDTCSKSISGKYVESEGKAYHKDVSTLAFIAFRLFLS